MFRTGGNVRFQSKESGFYTIATEVLQSRGNTTIIPVGDLVPGAKELVLATRYARIHAALVLIAASLGAPPLRADDSPTTNRIASPEGIAFFDLTSIYEGVTESVYLDDCCHLTPRGRRILVRAMASRIVDGLRRGSG